MESVEKNNPTENENLSKTTQEQAANNAAPNSGVSNPSQDEMLEKEAMDILPSDSVEPIALDHDGYSSGGAVVADEDDFLDDQELPTDEEDAIVEQAAHSTPHNIVEEITKTIVNNEVNGEMLDPLAEIKAASEAAKAAREALMASVQNSITDSTPSTSEEKEAKEESSPETPSNETEATLSTTESESATEEAKEEISEMSSPTQVMEELENHEEEHAEEEVKADSILNNLPDFSSLDKEGLLDFLRKLAAENISNQVDATIKKIKEAFTALRNAEEEEAKTAWVEAGNEAADFNFKRDEITKQFDTLVKEYQAAFRKHREEQDKQRENALETKKGLLAKLKELVDSQNPNQLNALRAIQDEWKAAGPVPTAFNRDLNLSYHALLDKFFQARAIYKELRDLDSQRNKEAKEAIIAKATLLLEETNLGKAIGELKRYQDEYTQVGQVHNREENESLWAQFRKIGDQLFEKRRKYQEEMSGKFAENLVKKRELTAKAQSFESFDSDRIDDWNAKSDEVKALQTEWENSGPVAEDQVSEVRKAFWNSIKKFFSNKSNFFKKLEKERAKLNKEKIALIEQAEELKESTDWNATTQKLIELQNQWKALGNTSGPDRNSLYNKFKRAVDAFFEAKRNHFGDQESNQKNNLESKLALIEKIEALTSGSEPKSLEAIEALIAEYNAIGFVPKESISTVQQRLSKAVDAYFRAANLDDLARLQFKTSNNIGSGGGRGGNDRRDERRGGGNDRGPKVDPNDPIAVLRAEENSLKRRMQEMENQIALWNNNLQFFARSRNADALRADVEQKINKLGKDYASLKDNLKKIQAEIREKQQ